MIDGLLAMNAPPEIIERARARSEKANFQECEIWPENEESFVLFEAMATQWRVSAMGSLTGIDYPALDAAMNMIGISKKRRPQLFSDIRIMERAALPILNRKKN